jgi:hypothetical protein
MSRRRLPSPSLVISMLALFVSLGGVGYAAATIGTSDIKNGAVTSKKIRNSTIRSRDVRRNSLGPRAIAERRLRVGFAGTARGAGTAQGFANFAVVGSNGVFARGRNVSSTVRSGPGLYQVIFTRNVRGCAYAGSVGVIGATTPGSGMLSTSSLASNVNGVLVRTFNHQGNAENKSFHLLVSC